MQMLNRIGPSIETWGTWRLCFYQCDNVMFFVYFDNVIDYFLNFRYKFTNYYLAYFAKTTLYI